MDKECKAPAREQEIADLQEDSRLCFHEIKKIKEDFDTTNEEFSIALRLMDKTLTKSIERLYSEMASIKEDIEKLKVIDIGPFGSAEYVSTDWAVKDTMDRAEALEEQIGLLAGKVDDL